MGLVDIKPVPRLVGSFSTLIYEGLTESDGFLSILALPCRKPADLQGPFWPLLQYSTHLSIAILHTQKHGI